jgi:hypothetical protein
MFGRVRRDAAAAARVDHACAWAAGQGLHQLYVMGVYQHAHRGSKALVGVNGDQQVIDAWFWWHQVHPGELVFVRLSVGWGTHTSREGVHYIGGREGGSGVLAV